jgi:hypothetical protein
MNVVIGRVGITIKFKGFKRGNKSAIDTDMILFSTLSQMNPDYNFYFIGPSDFSKLTEEEYDEIFPKHNVFSAYDNSIRKTCEYDKVLEYFDENNIKIDFAIIATGGSSAVCIPNFYPRKDGGVRSLLASQKIYMGPYMYVLNKLGCPLYVVADDARNVLLNFRDLYNRERISFTQCNCELETITHITSENDFTLKTDKVKCKYAHIERIDLIGLNKNWKDNINIDAKLNCPIEDRLLVISHGNGTKRINSNVTIKDGRLKGYKEYIIDNFKDTPYKNTKIYGIWEDSTYETYPNNFEKKPMDQLVDKIKKCRYSLVYSQIYNFVTIKPWEMVTNGIIPFIHPEYDPYHILGLPEYVYVKDADDFKRKVFELDSDNELYLKVLNGCLDSIKEEDIDGTYINNFIMSNIAEDLGFDYIEKKEKIVFNNFNNMCL